MRKSGSLWVVAVSLSAAAADAQEALPRGPETPISAREAAARQSDGLEEIIVTAQKRAEPLQKVPVAVTAFSGDTLAKANVDSLAALKGLVPGMTITRSGASLNTPQLSIRGISLQDVSRAVESGVGFSIDGVPLAFTRGALMDAFDVERLEVLRGPQGLLFGRNTTGGTINIIRSRPDPDKGVTGKVRGTIGSFGRTDFESVVMAPVIPGLLAAKGAISIKKHDGEFRNIVRGGREGRRDMRDYQIALVATPSDRTNLYLSFQRMEDDSEIPPYVPIHTVDRIALPRPILLTPTGLGTFGLPTYVNGRNIICQNPNTSVVCVPISKQRNGVETHQFPGFYNLTAITFEASHQLDGVRLVSLSGLRKDKEENLSDFDATRFALQRVAKHERSKSFSQEIRAETSFDGPFNFVAGAFYTKYSFTAKSFPSVDIAGTSTTAAPGLMFRNSNNSFRVEQHSRSAALFFQGDLDVTDKLRLTAGARQTWDRKSTEFTLWTAVVQPVRDQFFLGPQLGPVRADVKFRELTPKVSLQYKFTPNFLTYATYTRGYNAGGFNGRAGNIVNAIIPYEPEIMDSFEAGLKSEWFDRRLRFNVAVFHNTLNDKQEDVLTAIPGGGIVTATVNAAKARYKGVELEVAASPVRGWTISGSAGYLKANYVDYVANLAGQGLADVHRLKLRRTPKWTAGLISDYVFDAGPGRIGLNGVLYYTSRYETNVLNDPRGSIPPVAKIDLGARYEFTLRDGLDLQLAAFVKNVTDNTTYDGTTSANTLNQFIDFVNPNVGRTWGTSLTARF